ncbi:general odorant-binding protein 19d-like [Ctenocephalides felis]|uniref:general odorant-binding protein 19d-like n=1 Tax=Ctenocephalides felis TaxID=7515 RepID=UPI00003D480A|nr:general odorant-binding protein 19d-like [Ctenocephalides felis]
MKIFLVIGALVALYSVAEAAKYTKEEAKEKLLQIGKDCAVETGASSDDIEKLLQKNIPDSKAGKCMINCVYKKLGVMKDGKYHPDAGIEVSAMVHEHDSELMEKVKKIATECDSEAKGEDECEIAAKAMACGVRMAKEHNLMDAIPI